MKHIPLQLIDWQASKSLICTNAVNPVYDRVIFYTACTNFFPNALSDLLVYQSPVHYDLQGQPHTPQKISGSFGNTDLIVVLEKYPILQ